MTRSYSWAALGTRVHEMIEHWLKTGELPQGDSEASKLARTCVQRLTPFKVTLKTRAGRVVHHEIVVAETPGDARTQLIRDKYGPRVFWDAAEDNPRAGRVVDLAEKRRGDKVRLVEKPLTPCLALKIERMR